MQLEFCGLTIKVTKTSPQYFFLSFFPLFFDKCQNKYWKKFTGGIDCAMKIKVFETFCCLLTFEVNECIEICNEIAKIFFIITVMKCTRTLI